MGAPAYEQPLYADMDRAKGLVEAKTAEIDSKLIQPASDAFKRAFSAYPLTTLFFVCFAVLSVFPVLAFVGFALCAGSIIFATFLVILFGWLTFVIGSSAAVLAITIGISFAVTGGVALAVVAYKLFTNVKNTASPRQGILLTGAEIKEYIDIKKPSESSQNENGYRVSTLPIREGKHVNGYHASPPMGYAKSEDE
ncbi:hypothetical protein P389DRAFT_55667 [Cystobasidium minutum MCA 4210]|uniref:uncharacterized protein n=1 Tax=Cystobasidium minutum MCA 4210 TaxID=1397322 RepID=UPI0034CD31B3|eukprot:jgi/Rhomi1/55667/CE55666_1154